MLLNFYFENFRSLFNRSVISMRKGSKRELEETLINKTIENDRYTLLPNKVIYGVNASGKTSIILAIEALQDIIINGSVYSENDQNTLCNLPIYHFLHDKDKFFKPMTLGISFLFKNTKYDYEIQFINKDTEPKYTSSVTYEKLLVNDITIFERKKNKFRFNPSNSSKFKKYINSTPKYLTETEHLLEQNIDDKTIFTRWFNLDGETTTNIKEWFSTDLKIFNDIDEVNYTPKILSQENRVIVLNQAIQKMVKEADFGPQKIEFALQKLNENNFQTSLKSSYLMNGNENEGILANSELLESLGTLKLIKLLGPFTDVMINGGVIVVDELDSSIHPEVIASIITTFNEPTVNIKGAQLIFTTHNPVFLNKDLLRRDEIVFVEKNPDTYISEINTLDDFDIKKDERYLKNYLEGKYINFTNIDFSTIIKEIQNKAASLNEKNEEN